MRVHMKYHIIAFLLGFILDLILGDPYWLPHPIRLIGRMIGALEKKWNTGEQRQVLWRGRLLVLTCLQATGLMVSGFLVGGYLIRPYVGLAAETIMTYQILSTKCLKSESMKVYRHLAEQNLTEARQSVSMIVGRDTQDLDEMGVAKAAIETVAENTSDGTIAPMFYTAIGGPILGFLYKTVNTMDSMIGYKNERYLHFGRCAAKLDDGINYVPSRISAYLMIAACFFAGKEFDGKRARAIHKRDCHNHASPNSAQTESVCAGALGIQLAGDASYFGKPVKKPLIGDPIRNVEYEDIRRANRLLYWTAFLHEGIWLMVFMGVWFIIQ